MCFIQIFIENNYTRMNIIVRNTSSVVFGVIVMLYSYSNWKKWRKRQDVKTVILRKRKEEKELIRNVKSKLKINTRMSKNIQTVSTINLIKKMKCDELKIEEVLQAFMLKALELNDQFNCVTNILPEVFDAINVKEENKEDMLLYGLPVSLKECIEIKGHDCTVGMAINIGCKMLEDSVIVQTLKHCGAIPFVRTNLPQTMCSGKSSNPIYGETSNPHNKDFLPGGSSSGEGCLIASGGSLLGFGTDYAGSIRVPAHMCGICALKPTGNRISLKGVRECIPGQTANNECVGPMAKDVETLVLAMRALLCDFMFKLDHRVPPLPFNNKVYEDKRKLRIGYYFTDGFNEPIPACIRAVEIAKKHLRSAGHELVKFEVPDIQHAMNLAWKAFICDGGENMKINLKYDQIDKVIKGFYDMCRKPWWWKKLRCGFNNKHDRQSQHRAVWAANASIHAYCNLVTDIQNYKSKFFGQWVKKLNLDAIICPILPVVAFPKDTKIDAGPLWSYCFLYNILNCPAGVIPVTKVTEEDIKNLDEYVGHHNDSWEKSIKELARESLNLPVTVQCVSLPWQDEMCLRVMKEIETLNAI